MLSLTAHQPPITSTNTANDHITTADNNTTKFDNATTTELSNNTTKINQTQYNTEKTIKTFLHLLQSQQTKNHRQENKH